MEAHPAILGVTWGRPLRPHLLLGIESLPHVEPELRPRRASAESTVGLMHRQLGVAAIIRRRVRTLQPGCARDRAGASYCWVYSASGVDPPSPKTCIHSFSKLQHACFFLAQQSTLHMLEMDVGAEFGLGWTGSCFAGPSGTSCIHHFRRFFLLSRRRVACGTERGNRMEQCLAF